MRPTIDLDVEILRENARVWRAYAGVPLRAVVKSEGYGWGFSTLVRALDDLVDGFLVADVEECEAVRALTARSIITLGDVAPGRVGHLLDMGAMPNVATTEGIEAALAWARSRGRLAGIRVGLCPALGWFGFTFEDLRARLSLLACPELAVEFWTHLTHPGQAAEQRQAFGRAEEALRAAGVRVTATDVESSAPLALGEAVSGSFVRLGVALFGARCGGGPSGIRCALRVEAPVVQRIPAHGQGVGYGLGRAPETGHLLVLRCGYGDGFVRVTGTEMGILSMGMQYTTIWREKRSPADSVALLHADTNLDGLASAAGVGPHEIIVRLGHAARGRS